LRFEIGTGKVYNLLRLPRKKYVKAALDRVMALYKGSVCHPSILVWECDDVIDVDSKLNVFIRKTSLTNPHEKIVHNGNDNAFNKKVFYYWDLNACTFSAERLFKEIIIGDLGGSSEFIASIYIFDTKLNTIFHLYDDRGVDIVSGCKDTLLPIYEKYNSWILDYDRKRIDQIFINQHYIENNKRL